ncbi:MAG: D-alanyl-D-alanine carboxypeptidase/D-alanyl-D-alanine-endopeptidase [Pseudomonadota bacterium]
MNTRWTRRAALAGLAAGAFGAREAFALDRSPLPIPRPGGPAPAPSSAPAVTARSVSADLVKAAGLGGIVGYAVVDAATGAPVDAGERDIPLPPASTAKAITALYALDQLGPDFQFETTIIATGPITNGRLEGDLVLVGSGDPLLDSDALGAMAAELKAAGLVEVKGRFLIYDRVLPWVERIAFEQPETAGYNPTITGLNLNFNRVHFEWKRAKPDYEFTLQARARNFRPAVTVSTMDIVDDRAPVFTYRQEDGRDRWTVARHALGNDGARWLPVRRPVAYAGEAFQSVARSHGIVLGQATRTLAKPEGQLLARHRSQAMTDVLRGMLRYSTNLTAEVAGLQASASRGDMPGSLQASADRMNAWAAGRFGASRTALLDHSGLGYGSRMTAGDMAAILTGANRADALRPLLRPVNLGQDDKGATVLAKTGTHNFVSALAGYIDRKDGRRLAFAIFCADAPRRNAVPIAQRERPSGSRSYANRARRLQKDLLRHWAVTPL